MQDTRRIDADNVVVICLDCKKEFSIPLTEHQEAQWRGGALIQRVVPKIAEDLGELLISGTCDLCWDKLFSDGED
jgi:hypothetical protein